MYSPFAIAALKAPAERERLAALEESSPVLARLLMDNLDAADQRLIAERDPVQREALRRADAEQRDHDEMTMASSVMKKMNSMATAVKKMAAPLTPVTNTAIARVSAIIEQRKAEREARRVSFLELLVDLYNRMAVARLFFRDAEVTTDVPPLLDEHVHSLTAAPRPGPLTNVRASVSHLVAA